MKDTVRYIRVDARIHSTSAMASGNENCILHLQRFSATQSPVLELCREYLASQRKRRVYPVCIVKKTLLRLAQNTDFGQAFGT